MILSENKVKHLFKLAKIFPREQDVINVQKKLYDVMSLVEEVKDVECKYTDPLYSISNQNDAIRKDEVVMNNTKNDIFDNLPIEEKDFSKQYGYYRIKKEL